MQSYDEWFNYKFFCSNYRQMLAIKIEPVYTPLLKAATNLLLPFGKDVLINKSETNLTGAYKTMKFFYNTKKSLVDALVFTDEKIGLFEVVQNTRLPSMSHIVTYSISHPPQANQDFSVEMCENLLALVYSDRICLYRINQYHYELQFVCSLECERCNED